MNVERLDRGQMFGLLAVLLGLLAPHAMRFPYWLTGVLLALFGWRLWLVLGQRKVPPGWVLLPIIWGLIYGILREFHTLLGRSGGVAVLSVLIAGKLLETRRRRDALLLIYLGYFLVVTNFLFDQTIALGAYLFAMVLAVTTLLVSWHSLVGMEGRWRALWGQVRLAAMLMLQAVPVMVLLFVFFPRIDGPLWKLPQDRAANRAGLADSMAPGSFSNLSQSDEVAFRATFHGLRPTQSQLYWRGPVFEDYDGTTWSQAPADGLPAPDLAPQGKAMPYTVTMEPHQRPWRLALDMPATLPDGAKLTLRLQVVGSPVDKRIRYDLAVATSYRAGLRERPDVLSRDLLLPAKGNPRARAQAEKWRTLPPRERVYAGLRFLGLQGLQYTLQPPIYGRDPIDAFVYEGRQGFCEHFASAFVFMMRAAQVPARVIGGYQGGDENGDYLIVRQADAHAWGEVWLPGEGWVRVDPTFEVAPARIERDSPRPCQTPICPTCCGWTTTGYAASAWSWTRPSTTGTSGSSATRLKSSAKSCAAWGSTTCCPLPSWPGSAAASFCWSVCWLPGCCGACGRPGAMQPGASGTASAASWRARAWSPRRPKAPAILHAAPLWHCQNARPPSRRC